MAQGGVSNSKPPPKKAPNPKRPIPQNSPTEITSWWPLDDGPHSTDGGGSASQLFKQQLPNNLFTSTSSFGAMFANNGACYRYDPLVGGYCYDNNKGPGFALSSALANEINFRNFSNLGSGDPASVSVWGNMTANPTHTFEPVLHRDEGGQTNISIRALQASGVWEFKCTQASASKVVTGTNTIILNRWYHFVATFDGTTCAFYINGELIGTVAAVPDIFGTNQWKLGNTNDNNNPFQGYIWNMMWFSRALKLSEIKNMFLNPFNPFVIMDPPIIVPEVPVVPPPPGTPGVPYTLLVGRPATPIPSGQQIISNNSGPKPIF